MTTYVALLRGINVGGKNKLPMKELKEMFAAAGCRNVLNYIQSGNVVFQAEPRMAKQLAASIPVEIEKVFGHKPPVLLRSAEQIRAAIRANPFLKEEVSPDTLFLMFLNGAPESASSKLLDPDRSPGDRYIVSGQEIYMQLATGAAVTKLTNAYFDSKLKTVSTVRNWRTVLKLEEMAGAYGS